MSFITTIARKLHKKKQTPELDSEPEAPFPAPRPANSHPPAQLKKLFASPTASPILPMRWWKYRHINPGTLNLPVEIWLEIFKLVCAAAVAPANIDNEIPDSLFLNETCELSAPTIISEYELLQSPALFKNRRTFVLVCKAWHFMTISILRSHIVIDNNRWPDGYSNLIKALRRDPSFGPSVMRISVIDKPAQWPRSQEPDWSQKGADLVQQMAPMMPNLRIFTCRYRLTRESYFAFNPEITIMHEEVASSRTQERRIYIRGQNLITLSLSFQLSQPSGFSSSTPSFPNLVNLTLTDMAESSHWYGPSNRFRPAKTFPNPRDMPKLLSLAISSDNPRDWVSTIALFSSQLQRLELLHNKSSYSESNTEFPPMLMPKLTAVCLFTPRGNHDHHPALSWSREVKAPKLRRFCFHVSTLKPHSADHCCCLRGSVSAILRSYPLVNTLAVCSLIGVDDALKELAATDPQESTHLTPEDIINWCNLGLKVEINSQLTKKIFTKETLGDL